MNWERFQSNAARALFLTVAALDVGSKRSGRFCGEALSRTLLLRRAGSFL